MVSIRSLTGHSYPSVGARWQGGVALTADDRDVVPPRPPPRRQPRPGRRLRRRRRAAAVRARPRAVGTGRAVRRAYLAASLRALDASLRQRHGRALGGPRRPGPPGACWPRARSAPTRVHVAADYGPYGHRRDDGGREGAGRARHRAGAHRLAVRRRPGPGDQAATATRTRSSRRSRRPGPSTAGAAPVDAPTGAHWLALDDTVDIPDAEPPDGLALPEAGEAAAAAALAGVPRRRGLADYDDRARPARPRRHLADVRAPQVGRDPPAHDAGRPRTAAQRRRRDVPQGAGLARVLRRRAVPPAGDRARLPPARVRADGVRRARRDRLDAWRRGPDRLPDRRRRDAAAAGDRLDAQPGADDRGQLPGQGPARRVAARRAALHALAGRRRPGLQPARLAVDRRLRHRRGAVLPGLQPDQPRAASSTRTARYVRRWVPELADAADPHEPGEVAGYPAPIVDHAEERREALDRLERIKA